MSVEVDRGKEIHALITKYDNGVYGEGAPVEKVKAAAVERGIVSEGGFDELVSRLRRRGVWYRPQKDTLRNADETY